MSIQLSGNRLLQNGHSPTYPLMRDENAATCRMVITALNRFITLPKIFVTDGLSVYKNVAKKIGYDLIHVQCIHEPPYKRVIIDQILYVGNEVITTTLATGDDILKETNAFVA